MSTPSREHERLAQHLEPVAQSIRAIGHADHVVAPERGVRRNGQRIADDIHAQREPVRAIAQREGLSQTCVERSDKAERVVPTMHATIACVAGSVRQQVEQLDVTPPASSAMPAQRMPSYDLDRVAQTRTVREGEVLRELAERLRTPLFAPGEALRQLNPEGQDQLHQRAQTLAAVQQFSFWPAEGLRLPIDTGMVKVTIFIESRRLSCTLP